ncbi:MAG: hypothetical protein DRH03_10435 [Deltaproteobacteria bacterium]|nr:MAG: hypothetical protein DRH03_10435 [Deltaproteobacteria bacterium]
MPTKYQRSFYPVEITRTYNNDSGSVDMRAFGVGSDNRDYAIKQLTDGSGRIPATEMFCYELAQCFDIATPGYTIVKLRDGSLAFGSVIEGGVGQIKNLVEAIEIFKGRPPVRGLKEFFSKVYAFDLFINNIDRHLGNYLFRHSLRSTIAMAFDFGRAWYEIDAYGYQATNQDNKTQAGHVIISQYNQYDLTIARQTLREIAALPKSRVEAILNSIPNDWFHDSFAADFLNWWGSEDMSKRIVQLRKDI